MLELRFDASVWFWRIGPRWLWVLAGLTALGAVTGDDWNRSDQSVESPGSRDGIAAQTSTESASADPDGEAHDGDSQDSGTKAVAARDDDESFALAARVLQARCLPCHNANDPKGDFSVQDARSLFADGYIESGDADASHLMELVEPQDGLAPRMPKTGGALSAEERQALREWIEAGAKWPEGRVLESRFQKAFDWWSLQPLIEPKIPDVSNSDDPSWIRNPIDAFVLRGLGRQGLRPSAEADRRTLIRRLSYDLTGLPPTYEEVVRFCNDPRDDAYERLVERLLASPGYGERWAQHWLDVAKYADTCGYDKDKLRPNAWPYRDYVIDAFQSDKPYSQFVREQVAGDVLYPETPDGILGLGFLAAGPWDFIGHVEVSESKIDGKVARNLDRDDMLSNVFNTFCSTTLQCARCHDHKFDPFSQLDYYRLQSVFAAVDRANRVYQTDPEVEQQRRDLIGRLAEADTRLATIQREMTERGGDTLRELDEQLAALANHALPEAYGYHSQLEAKADVEKWLMLEFAEPVMIEQLVVHPCFDEFGGIGAGFGFPVRFRIEVDGEIALDHCHADFPNPGIRPLAIPIQRQVTRIKWVTTRLAERTQDFIMALGEIEVLDAAGKSLQGRATLSSLDSIEAPPRWRLSHLTDGIWYEDTSGRKTALELARKSHLMTTVGRELLAEQAELLEQRKAWTEALQNLPQGRLVYAAATDFQPEGQFQPTRGVPREIRFLNRGDVQTPGELVEPGIPTLGATDRGELLLSPSLPEGDRRAALAQWLTRSEHPLVWRSIVNRVWQYHFGQGLVTTPNDFGRMGALPTHPELLDWLAVQFRDGGGSFKALHRLIVTSSTYRQSSQSSPRGEEIDAGNQWLWKFSRRRLTAEEIRDSILLATGKLNREQGGPGFALFELSKPEHSPHFEYDQFDHENPECYRRSIYRFVVRSQPDPYLTVLDCADSSQSTPLRLETQTPLQSLSMLNSRFHLVMAEHLAERLNGEAESPREQVNLAIGHLLQRSATEEELTLLTTHLQEHGMVNVARILFNLSELIYVD